MEKIKALLDKTIEKVISRKFLAWLTATGLAGYGLLESSDWVAVTVMFRCFLFWLLLAPLLAFLATRS